jgi:hypothetical protein
VLALAWRAIFFNVGVMLAEKKNWQYSGEKAAVTKWRICQNVACGKRMWHGASNGQLKISSKYRFNELNVCLKHNDGGSVNNDVCVI